MISDGANNKQIKRKRLSSTGHEPSKHLNNPKTQTRTSDDEQGPV